MRLGYVLLDKNDPTRTFLEVRVGLPRSPRQIMRRRRHRRFMRSLPPNTNVTQVIRAPMFSGSRKDGPDVMGSDAQVETLPCGHPFAAVVSADEGTSYCGWCVDLDALAAQLAETEQQLEATEADALALLDQHASPEVHKETRVRLIERAAARAPADQEGDTE